MVQPLLYRGLALQSCIYKIYSSLLNERIGSYLEGEDLISEMQNGFRRNRSCNQHLFVINELTQIRLDENKSTFLCFVDFRKAFDYVDRDLLLVKLAELGICGKVYNAIKSAYTSTMSAVRLNGEIGRWFEIYQGTKQGDNLSPNVFSVYTHT